MADVRRLVRWPRRPSRPVVLLDLETGGEAGAGIRAARDTWAVQPGDRQAQLVPRAGRHGGERPVSEHVGNATISCTYRVRGSSVDDCLARIDGLIQQVELARAQGNAYIEWRSELASMSKSSFYRLMGPGRATFVYQDLRVAAIFSLDVEVAWPVLPKAFGLPMAVYEDFTDDATLDDFTIDAGAGTLNVTSDRLGYSATGEKRWRYSGRGYEYDSVEVIRKVHFGASLGTATNRFGIRLAVLDDQNYLRTFIKGDNEMRLQKVDGGAPADLAGGTVSAAPAIAANGDYYFVGRKDGNVFVNELWTGYPLSVGSAKIASGSHTLSGANATKFGDGVLGEFGGYDVPFATDWYSDELEARPYVFRGRTGPTRLDIKGVPGGARAEVTVELYSASGAIEYWGMLAVDQFEAPIEISSQPFGALDANSVGSNAGFASAAVAGALGGNVMRHSMSAGGAALSTVRLQHTVKPAMLRAADDFEEATIPVEVWVAAYLPTGALSPRAVLSSIVGGLSGPRDFSLEGQGGTPLVVPTAAGVRRFFRVGTLLLDRTGADDGDGRGVSVILDFTYAAGSTGNLDVDYLVFASPVRTALLPTGRSPADVGLAAGYPQLLPISGAIKRVLPDLSTTFRRAIDPINEEVRSGPFGGYPLALPPGDSSLFAKVSQKVPDDPTASAAADTHDAFDIVVEVVPTWPLIRA